MVFAASVERGTEILRSLSALAAEALKASLLINGGAIVALLAYAGTAPSSVRAETAHSFSGALLFFGAGVFCATLALGLSYSAQLRFYNSRVAGENMLLRSEGILEAAASANRLPTDAEAKTLAELRTRLGAEPPHERFLFWAQFVGYFSVVFFLLGSVTAFLVLGAGGR